MENVAQLSALLLAAGYRPEDVEVIVGNAPAVLAEQVRPDAVLDAVKQAGPPHPLLLELVRLLRQLLGQLVDNVNLTPGQHPVTAQVLARMDVLLGAGAKEA